MEDSPWFATVIGSFFTLIATVVTAFLGKKKLEEEIERQDKIITDQNQKIKDLNYKYDETRVSYLEIIQKLKTLRDFEIAVDGKDISKLLNKDF